MKPSYFAVKPSSFHAIRGEKHDDPNDRRNICRCHTRHRARGRSLCEYIPGAGCRASVPAPSRSARALDRWETGFHHGRERTKVPRTLRRVPDAARRQQTPLQQFLTATLLTEAATPEATRQLAQDLAQMAAGAYAAANLAAPDAPVAWTQKVTQPAVALAEASSVRA